MMSTVQAPSVSHNHSFNSESAHESVTRTTTGKLGQGWSLPKLGIKKADSDSGIGSSDSSDSMCDVKDSFQEAIMNLKALNGDGDNTGTEVKEIKQLPVSGDGVSDKPDNCNGKDSMMTSGDSVDHPNGDGVSAVDSPDSHSKPSDNGHDENICEKSDDSVMLGEETSAAGPEEHSEQESRGSEVMSEEPTEVHSEELSEAQSEVQSEAQSEAHSEVPSEVQSEIQSESEVPSEVHSEETSQDAAREDSVEPEMSDSQKQDKIEIVDSDNDESKEAVNNDACDDDIMIVSDKDSFIDKDEKSMDSESGDHPLTIGDKVKKSVRDIMSKLKQGISPELNKLLVKPKLEAMDVDQTEVQSEQYAADKSKAVPQSPRKGNLFENLTVIGSGAGTSDDSKPAEEDKSAIEKEDEQNDSKNSVEILGSQESDIELIEDSDFDKKDDEVILFDEDRPTTKQNSGNSSANPQDDKDIKVKSDSKSFTQINISVQSEACVSKPLEEKLKQEVKPSMKAEATTADKPMEIDDDDDDDDEEEEEDKEELKPLVKITPPSDKSEDSSDVCPATRNDRKRSQDSLSADSGAPPKRSRLDMVIGKLGSQIGISPDTIKTDSSDEDSRPGSDTSEKSEDNMSSVSDEDDKTSQSSTKTVRLSGKELEALVRSKVSAYLKAHRDSKMDALKAKLEELQAANETWRTQAKELQKQVLDLTVLQQRLEKRKAATAALRQITTRSVAVQADDTKDKQTASSDNKTNFATGQAVKQAKTPPKAAAPPTSMSFSTPVFSGNTVTAPVSSTSIPGVVVTCSSKILSSTTSQIINSSAVSRSVSQLLSATAVPRPATSVTTTQIGNPGVAITAGIRPQLAQHLGNTTLSTSIGTSLTTVRSLLDNSKTIDTTSKLQTVPGQALSGSNVIVVSSPTLPGQVPKGVVTVPKVIDLTSDDDSAKGPATGSQQSRTMQVVPCTSVSALRPGLVQQQVIRGVNPLTLQQSLPTGTSILLSSPAGLVNAGTPNLTRPGGTFQIVTVASGSNLRPGTLLTVVPAASPVTTQQTQIRSAIPSVVPIVKSGGTTVNQAMPQLRPVTPISQVSVTTAARSSSTSQSTSTRPPPPLQTAPAPTSVSTPVSLAPAPPVTPPAAQKHPAPLPPKPANQTTRGIKGQLPPKPGLKISRVSQGIVLSWNMTINDTHAEIASYQLFAYQESSAAPSTSLWKKVGDVKALPLPMACTLTQFQEGNKYHFAVRAVDVSSRIGDFSDPSTIHLTPK